MAANRKTTAPPPPSDDVLGDDDAFWKEMKGRFPDRGKRNIDGLNKVKAVYVDCARDDFLLKSFDFFLQDFFSTRNGKRGEADVFFFTGESGAGKSEAIARMLREHPVLQPIETSFGRVKPYVSVKLSGFTHPRLAGQRIVREAGYPIRRETQRGEMWEGMAAQLRARRTFLVHVDETQHLIKQRASQQERQDLADAIKGVSIDNHWPVAFVLSGLPEVAKIPVYDEQFERRGRYVEFHDVEMPGEEKLVWEILRKLAGAVDLDVEELVRSDLPRRLAHAANFKYARICKAVVSAIHEALDEDAAEVTRDHFAEAYVKHSQAYGIDDANPFLAKRWEDLKPGSFLVEEEVVER